MKTKLESQSAAQQSSTLSELLVSALVTPVRAMRLRYLPLLMIYFAYGALGLISVAENFWVKETLTLNPADLAALGVWVTLPWTIKMVFGQFVDSIPLFGSQRRIYVFLGAGLIAFGILQLWAAASAFQTIVAPDTAYIIASITIVIGFVIQDVGADAMSTEVVDRTYPDGSPRPDDDVKRDLGIVQVLGRLALTFGAFAVAGIAGWIAQVLSYETVFLLGLTIPLISLLGAMFVRLDPVPSKEVDWRILGGGLAFGVVVLGIGIGGIPFGQEIVFLVSMIVVCTMLVRVIADLDPKTKQRIFFAALIIFAFRAMPGTGDGYTWFSIDVLGFDEAFFGILGQIGMGLAMAGTWLLSDTITRRPVTQILFWLTIIGSLFMLPNVALVFGIHEWTNAQFGIGPRTIALVDTALGSPFAQLSMIPLLTLIAVHAPAGRRATWFALMASLMNLALVAGQLQTKYLNTSFQISRGQYDDLPGLIVTVAIVGLVVPILVILLVGKRVE